MHGNTSVYPRWRGEHFLLFFNSRNKRGLSPLARGTRGRDESPLGFRRFIPAGAGNTAITADLGVFSAVYPRWRGEHFAAAYFLRRYTGLSPLARGTRRDSVCVLRNVRFIPAGAGNTRYAKIMRHYITVYPRWRGEHDFFNMMMRPLIGLSPLARGTH